MADSSATQAGFDGTVRLPHPRWGWAEDFPLRFLRGFGFDALANAIKAGRTKRNTIIWVKDEERLFYLNREGKLYELTFTEVDYATQVTEETRPAPPTAT